MGLWIFLLFMNLFFLFTMLWLGKQYQNGAPQNANSVFSYQTRMSLINRSTREFSHAYIGRIWYVAGRTLLVPTLIAMSAVYGKSSGVTGFVGGFTAAVSGILFVSAVPATEIALKKNFDESGKRKSLQTDPEAAKRSKKNRRIEGINLTKKREKEKRIVKITGWIMLGLDFLALLSFNETLLFGCPLIVLFTAWAMYIWMYPDVFLDLSQTVKLRKHEIKISAYGIGFAYLLIMFNDFNYSFRDFMIFLGIFMFLLLIPLILKFYKIKEKPEKSSITAAVLLSFFLAFVIVIPINHLTTFQNNWHESITITEKSISTYRLHARYYVYADWKQDTQSFLIPERLYKDVQEGDRLRVCIRRSIFGFCYWTVHK